MKKASFFITLFTTLGIMMILVFNANADTIMGIATDDGSLTPVGNLVDGKYKYFIHLGENNPTEVAPKPAVNVNGVYGVTDVNGGTDNYGTFSDSIQLTTAEQINGPGLDMFFHLAVPTLQIGTSVTIWNDDLDLELSNDPTGFFEDITLYGQWGMPGTTSGTTFTKWGEINSLSHVTVNPLPSDSSINGVGITFTNLIIPEGDNWLKVSFSSYSKGFGAGTWYNTPELISVTMETQPVPEPATLSLLGIGIAGFAGIEIRRRQKK